MNTASGERAGTAGCWGRACRGLAERDRLAVSSPGRAQKTFSERFFYSENFHCSFEKYFTIIHPKSKLAGEDAQGQTLERPLRQDLSRASQHMRSSILKEQDEILPGLLMASLHTICCTEDIPEERSLHRVLQKVRRGSWRFAG